jgi:hypothetical protein
MPGELAQARRALRRGKGADGERLRWLDPAGERPAGEVSAREQRRQDGSGPRLLDLIEVPLLGPRPATY